MPLTYINEKGEEKDDLIGLDNFLEEFNSIIENSSYSVYGLTGMKIKDILPILEQGQILFLAIGLSSFFCYTFYSIKGYCKLTPKIMLVLDSTKPLLPCRLYHFSYNDLVTFCMYSYILNRRALTATICDLLQLQ